MQHAAPEPQQCALDALETNGALAAASDTSRANTIFLISVSHEGPLEQRAVTDERLVELGRREAI